MEDINADRPMTFDRALLTKLDTVSLSDDRTVPTGAALLEIKNSYGFDLRHVSMNNAWSSGLSIVNSSFVRGDYLDIQGTVGHAGIYVQGSSGVSLNSVLLEDSKNWGVDIQDSHAINLNYMRVDKAGIAGLNMTGSNDVQATRLSVLNAQRGIVLENNNRNIDIDGLVIQKIKGDGISVEKGNQDISISNLDAREISGDTFLSSGTRVKLSDFYIERTKDGSSDVGIKLTADSSFNRIERGTVQTNGLSPNGLMVIQGSGHQLQNLEIVRSVDLPAKIGTIITQSDIKIMNAQDISIDAIRTDITSTIFDYGDLFYESIIINDSKNIQLKNIQINDASIVPVLDKSISINNSQYITLEKANLPRRIIVFSSKYVDISDIDISTTLNLLRPSVVASFSENVNISNLRSDNDISIIQSKNVKLVNLSIIATRAGIFVDGSTDVEIRGASVIQSTTSPEVAGIDINLSTSILVTDVVIELKKPESLFSRGINIDYSGVILGGVSVILGKGEAIAFAFSGGALADMGNNTAYGFDGVTAKVCDGVADTPFSVKVWDGAKHHMCQ